MSCSNRRMKYWRKRWGIDLSTPYARRLETVPPPYPLTFTPYRHYSPAERAAVKRQRCRNERRLGARETADQLQQDEGELDYPQLGDECCTWCVNRATTCVDIEVWYDPEWRTMNVLTEQACSSCAEM